MGRLENSSNLRMQSEEDVFPRRIYKLVDVDGLRLRVVLRNCASRRNGG